MGNPLGKPWPPKEQSFSRSWLGSQWRGAIPERGIHRPDWTVALLPVCGTELNYIVALLPLSP
jgi:hypothetical protein